MKTGLRTLPFVMALCLLVSPGCGGGEESGAQTNSGDSGKPGATEPAEPERPSHLYPRVVVNTNMGEFVLELDAEKAPITVQNFLDYVDTGHYDDTIFHQVISDAIVLGGGYTTEFKRKVERSPIYNEADNGLKNIRGTIAMARLPDTIDSATCQFFINVADNPSFDHQGRDGDAEDYGYCVFGRVVKGMSVIDKLCELKVKEQQEGEITFTDVPTKMVRIDFIRRY